jgi:hypothetical protein
MAPTLMPGRGVPIASEIAVTIPAQTPSTPIRPIRPQRVGPNSRIWLRQLAELQMLVEPVEGV